MNILIADDSAFSLRLLKKFLLKWNYKVIEAKTGQQALDILSADNAPPIAILDWVMPDIEGVEVCRWIRQQDKEIQPHIILLTGMTDSNDIQYGIRCGIDDYLLKPLNAKKLKESLQIAEKKMASSIST